MFLAENTFAGLTVLQIALVSLALLIVMMCIYSGWQNGVVRQLLRIVAIIAAYTAGFKLGPILAPLIPLGSLTGAGQVAIVSLLTGFITYTVLRIVINTLFRKTRDQESSITRLIYGIGGGTIGLFFSVFFLLATIAGIRSLGTVADAQFRVAQKRHTPLPDTTRTTVMTQLSRARQAIETGPVAPIIETVDPTPAGIYQTIEKISAVTADPDAMNRFISFPGTRELMQHPSMQKVANDPAIQALAQKKDYVALLRDEKVSAMLKDDSLVAKLKTFEFYKALDYSLRSGPVTPGMPGVPAYRPAPTPRNY